MFASDQRNLFCSKNRSLRGAINEHFLTLFVNIDSIQSLAKSEQKRFVRSVAAVEHTVLEQHHNVPAFAPLSNSVILKTIKNELLKQITIFFLQNEKLQSAITK